MTIPFRLRDQYLDWLICFAYLGLLLPIKWGNIILTFPAIYALVCFDFGKVTTLWKENLFIKIIAAYYLILLIGLLYTTDLKSGFFILEKKFSLFIIPVLLMPHLMSFSEKSLGLLLKKMGIITMSGSVMVLLVASFKSIILKDTQAFFFEEFTPIHYVYYAIYFSFGSLIFLNYTFDYLRNSKNRYIIWATLFAYALGILILVSSKMGIISFVLGAGVLLYRRMANKKVFVVSLLILIGSLVTLIFIHQTTRQRFVDLSRNFEILNEKRLAYDVNEKFTGLNLRLLFWKFSVSHMLDEKAYIAGTGTGDAQHFLDESYTLHNLTAYSYAGWDPHNQWVFTFIQLGLVGVSLLIWLYANALRVAIRKKDFGLFCFLLITFCFSMTESILESNKGIVFFSIFYSIFLSTTILRNGSKSTQDNLAI